MHIVMTEDQAMIWLAAIFFTILAFGAIGFASIYYEQKSNKKEK